MHFVLRLQITPFFFSFLPFFLSADILHFRLCLFKQNLKIRLHAHLDAASKLQQNTITIQHTVIACRLNGKYEVIARDTTKTKSSRRTLPLAAPIRKYLLDLQVRQAENRRLCGNCYCKDYEGYICINEMGYLLNPNRVSAMFELTLQQNHLRHIRFHDLRHSSASLLLANHVPLKQIQEWLGHSDFSTTANIYAHLDAASKQNTAEAMLHGLGLEEE